MNKRRAKKLYADSARRVHRFGAGLTPCEACGSRWESVYFNPTESGFTSCPCWKMRLPKRKEK